jgi:hypothetical protein
MVSYDTDGERSGWERNPSLPVDEVLSACARAARARLRPVGARP